MRYILILILILTLTACQSNLRVTYMPIVDKKGVNLDNYYHDLEECQDAAKPIEDNTIIEGLTMAAVGAGVGAAMGSAYGMTGVGAQYGAIAGAGIGTVDGQSKWKGKTMQVIDNCLIGRGYRVLGRS